MARRLGLGIARAIFEAAGGSLRLQRGADRLSVEVGLLRDATTVVELCSTGQMRAPLPARSAAAYTSNPIDRISSRPLLLVTTPSRSL